MRDTNHLTLELSKAIQNNFSRAVAVAVGGSHSTSQQDDQSDLDLVVLLKEGVLINGARLLNETLLPLLEEPVSLVSGPSWKEGFGCRTSVLYADGFKVEIFVVTPDTTPVVDRVLRWIPIWGNKDLELLKRDVSHRLTINRILAKAQFDVGYAHMSVCRHLSRHEVFAARHVLTSYIAIALALRLLRLGKAYDPVASYKRIVRDGLISDEVIREIDKISSMLGGDASQLATCLYQVSRICWEMLDGMREKGAEIEPAQTNLKTLAKVPEQWLSELNS